MPGYRRQAGCQHPVRRSGEVLRGGSWINHRHNARCAYRNRNHPHNRNNNVGFRVVLRPYTFFTPFFWFRVFPRNGAPRLPRRLCSSNVVR
ncbi:MAG: SUMF1/EgtB/PvdO family nonheme iron enzyme [Rhodanobacteraceae bacterium]|nr:SUMF1/EgtB/PvdO family nonheme iron enzyme [Rhodanobacteraceae bacterium]